MLNIMKPNIFIQLLSRIVPFISTFSGLSKIVGPALNHDLPSPLLHLQCALLAVLPLPLSVQRTLDNHLYFVNYQ